MRIELNSGGLSGLIAISSFADSIEKLDDNIEAMISTFQEVKKAVGKLKGGVGKLSGAVDSLQRRIEQEQTKRNNLADFGKSFDDFLDLAVSIDDQAANLVNKNKDEFYQLNPHLRPELTVSEKLAEFVDNIGEALDKLGEFIKEHIDEAIVAVVAVAAVVVGSVLIIVTVITGGAVIAVIAGMALIGAGVGTAVAGWKSAKDDGDVDLLEAGKGFVLGFVAGAAIGSCLCAAGYIAVTFKGLGAFVAQNAVESAATMAFDFFNQTVIEGEGVGFANYDIGQTIYKGLKDFGLSFAFGGIMKITKFDAAISGFMNKSILKNLDKHSMLQKVLSNVPKNAIEAAVKSPTEYTVDCLADRESGDYTIGTFWSDILLDVTFGAISDSFSAKISKSKVDGTFNKLDSDIAVEPLNTNKDLFSDNIADLDRSKAFKTYYDNAGETIRSHDLLDSSYNKDNNLLNTLRKDLNHTRGDTLRVIVPNGDLSAPQISAFNQISIEAKELNINLVVSPQLITPKSFK